MRSPGLNARVAQISTAVYDADNIDLFVADNPINNSIVLKSYFANIVALCLRYESTAQRKRFQPIYGVEQLLHKVLGVNRCIATDVVVNIIERLLRSKTMGSENHGVRSCLLPSPFL
jgi:hypothetical protein